MRCNYLAHEVNLYFLNVVKYMGKPSVAFFPKIALCDRILLTIFSKKTHPLAFFAQSRNNDGLMHVQNTEGAENGAVVGGLMFNIVMGYDRKSVKRMFCCRFIYAFMGLGVVLCCISCIGHIAAEAIHGCCLCFYTILKIVLIQLKVALVGFIVLDHRWEKDLPEDPTESIDSIREFIEDNVEICKWVGIITLLPCFS
ncbi:hypothetical protein Hanom_Chr04g00346741 [Helianthus anomalus]